MHMCVVCACMRACCACACVCLSACRCVLHTCARTYVHALNHLLGTTSGWPCLVGPYMPSMDIVVKLGHARLLILFPSLCGGLCLQRLMLLLLLLLLLLPLAHPHYSSTLLLVHPYCSSTLLIHMLLVLHSLPPPQAYSRVNQRQARNSRPTPSLLLACSSLRCRVPRAPHTSSQS